MPTNKQSVKFWKWCGSEQNIQIELQTSVNVHDDGDDVGDHNKISNKIGKITNNP